MIIIKEGQPYLQILNKQSKPIKILSNQSPTGNCQFSTCYNFIELVKEICAGYDDKKTVASELFELLEFIKYGKAAFEFYCKKEDYDSLPDNIREFFDTRSIIKTNINDFYFIKFCLYSFYVPNPDRYFKETISRYENILKTEWIEDDSFSYEPLRTITVDMILDAVNKTAV